MARKTSTAEQLLEAANQLFAEYDYDDVSVRMLCEVTGANLASIRYHFGSKEALIAEVIRRGTRALHERRKARFEALEASPTPPTARQLVELVVEPLDELVEHDPQQARAYLRLLARLYLSRRPIAWELASEHVSPERWEALVVRAMPDLPPHEARARWALTIDGALLALADPFAREGAAHAVPTPLDHRARVATIIDFLAAGLGAPWEGAPQP